MSSGVDDIEASFNKFQKDASLGKRLLAALSETLSGHEMRFMEVCGTHTFSLFHTGLRSLLPKNITHLSGPGCPVCVTHESEVNLFLELARDKNIIITTFGDLLRVPGRNGQSLKHARAQGSRIEIVYSATQALGIADKNPGKEVVFLGIGFETTAPAIAYTIMSAAKLNRKNFSVLSMHKRVPPVLQLLAEEKNAGIDAFMLPGHVAMITGESPFSFLAKKYKIPSVIAGFEPVDLLLALLSLARQLIESKPVVQNMYGRAVQPEGNPAARRVMEAVFSTGSSVWRGIGAVNDSGLIIREEFGEFDAMRKFALELKEAEPLPGCQCGKVLKGIIMPYECPLFAKKCTPASPVGPCMVSTEGSCAAHFKYGKI